MPLNVRRFFASVLLVLFGFIISASSQTTAAVTTPQPAEPRTPTAGEVMRERISKAKANIAVRNYNAAVYELETIRRETNDPAVNAVVNGLLMNVYIDRGDYKRAEDFLRQTFDSYQSNNAHAELFYSAVAGQVVKGSRNKVDRYRAFGLMVSDRNLPLEAVNDLERMRELLELVITQSKQLGEDEKKAQVSVALLEEATVSRSSLARDDYDAKRWRDAMADSRERMTSSRSTIFDVVDPPPATVQTAETDPESSIAAAAPAVLKPVSENAEVPAAAKNAIVPAAEPARRSEPGSKPVPAERSTRIVANVEPAKTEKPSEKTDEKAPESAGAKPSETGPLDIGSLIDYATHQAKPVYPPAARSMRASGVVRVAVIVDENGEVEEVQDADGPSLLQNAARDAARKWKFRPFTRDGQPVKAVGFLNFNFTL